ncbi:hypothetical protein TNIN_427751, partial [Trichonephila inaurata madagascariensis]
MITHLRSGEGGVWKFRRRQRPRGTTMERKERTFPKWALRHARQKAG